MTTAHDKNHPDSTRATKGAAARSASPRSDSHRVLVVEDERRLREMLLASLQEIGMTPTGAPNAETALRLLDQSLFAVALVDLNLPGMSGMEFCEAVHRRWPLVQLVILTGFGDIEAAKRAIRLDVVDFLTKPCGMDELETALSRARHRWVERFMAIPHNVETIEASLSHDTALSDSSSPQEETSVAAMERRLILAALERHPGNREAVAAEIGISVRKLYYRIQQYQRDGYLPPKGSSE